MNGAPTNYKRLRKLVNFIQRYHKQHGYAPCVREMGEAIGGSTSLINYYMLDLQNRGVLEYTPKIARTVRVLPVDLDEKLPIGD